MARTCHPSQRTIVISIGAVAIIQSLGRAPPVMPIDNGASHLPRNGTMTKDFPEIVWLLSFPNSGTTYTLKSVQALSGTTTATNYGALEVPNSTEMSKLLGDDGPFLRWPDRPLPTNYLLTKTHCDRKPFPNASFPMRCRTGVSLNDETETTAYSTPVRRAIHLIRNPMDNTVAKWNYFRKTQQDHRGDASTTAILYHYIQKNFTRWCQYLDLEAKQQQEDHVRWNASFYATYMEPLPCALDYVRYFEWHRAATTELKLKERMMVYYEDYPVAMDLVLQFLELVPRSMNQYYSSAPVYSRNYYNHSSELRRKVQRLGAAMCDAETWKLFERYFAVG